MADYSAGNLFLNIDAVATNTLKNLDAVIGRLNFTNSGLGKITKTSKLFKIASWTAVLYSARRLGGYMAKIVQYGADYTETLNLWQTAMGGNLNIATEFVNKMNEAYGISEKTLMNAQAIFKNMLGSLGEISSETAYRLSEGITQMALDYASLYNVTFEQAFTKFQAALAGQVRPIRSVSGYDITENTLFQLYQELGGTKTMRQLSRTEKQLLAIYAIFNQMDKSGAVGDLDKTMQSFANQSRVMAEAWQRVLTYSGLILTHLIEESQLMTYLNAVLIFVGDTLMAVAGSMGAVKSFGDIFESTTDGALDANKAIDEVQGKLLGFDKFRSLSGNNEENALGLDEKLLEKLSKFQSILGGASMEAKKLAEEFKLSSGLFDENGVFNKERWEEIKSGIKLVSTALIAIFSTIGLISKIPFIFQLLQSVPQIFASIKGTISTIITFLGSGGVLAKTIPFLGVLALVISALYIINEDFRELINDIFAILGELFFDLLEPLGDLLVSFAKLFVIIIDVLNPLISVGVELLYYVLIPTVMVLEATVKILSTLIYLLNSLFSWDWENLGSKLGNLWSDWSATGDLFVKVKEKYFFANGGLPDKGTMFVAGEAGAEMVYNMPSGQSGVANIQQIAQATYNGTARALRDWWGGNGAREDIPQIREANPTGLYEAVTSTAKSRGKVWAKV